MPSTPVASFGLPNFPDARRPYLIWIEEEVNPRNPDGEMHGVSPETFFPPIRPDQDPIDYVTHQCRLYLGSRYRRGTVINEYPNRDSEPICCWYGRSSGADELIFRAALYRWEYAEEQHAACRSRNQPWPLAAPPDENEEHRAASRQWEATLISRIYTDSWKDG